MNYQEITGECIWLEDKGKYSRYATQGEESVWICHDCEETDVDPYEQECGCN